MDLNQKSLQERRNLYDKNIKALYGKYPEVVSQMHNIKYTNNYTIKTTGKRNLPNIFINKLSKYYYKKNDPIEDVKRHILSLELKKTNIAIFLGFGLGYELLFFGNALSEQLQTKQVLVIEKNIELFKQALEWIDFTIFIENCRIKFIIGENGDKLESSIDRYLNNEEVLNCLDAISTIYHPSAFLLDKEYYSQAIKLFNSLSVKKIENNGESSKTFEQNMKALVEYYPSLAKKLIEIEDSGKYKFIKTGDKNLYNLWIENTQTFYYDFENPILDSEQQIEQLKLKNTRLALFLGCGLGYELKVFKNKVAIDQNTLSIIIVEKDLEIFKMALYVTDLTEYISKAKIKFLVGVESDKLYEEIQLLFEKQIDILWLIKTLKPVYHSSSILLYKEYYLRAIREMKNASAYMLNFYGNDPQDSLIGVENMLLNLKEILNNPGINLLKDKFKNKAAVVVSSGPSLNKNKHLLKGIENKAVIIAADSALRVLTGIGVKPHFITALERTRPLVRLFEGFGEQDTKDVYLAACPVVDPCIYDVYKGPRVIVYRNFDHFKWLDLDKGILDIKQSAGNMSFKIAEYLGCDPIILIGQDLAYGNDGNTHAIGTNLENDIELQKDVKSRGLLEVKGNVEETVLTSKMWYEFLKGYEQDLRTYEGLCINSTEGGAYIQGTKVLTFEKAIEKYIFEDINTLRIIKENATVESNKVNEDFLRINNKIDETMSFIDNIIITCEDGEKIIEKYYSKLNEYLKNDNKLNDKDKEFLQDVEKDVIEIKNKLYIDKKMFQLFLMHIVQPYIIKFEIEMLEMPECYDDIWIAKARVSLEHKKYFLTIKEIAKICKEMLVKTRENMNYN